MTRPTDLRAAIAAVPPRGYRWWYVDGLSDDGRRGFTAIFLIGSVFSAAYARRVWRGEAVPATDHLGVHVVLYEDGRELAWTTSEYPVAGLGCEVGREDSRLRIGGSRLTWHSDGTLVGEIDERSAPVFWSYFGFGRRMRGRFVFTPSPDSSAPEIELARSATGEAHRWKVCASHARIRVEFDHPGFRFEGRAYHDTNWGEGRLEAAFKRWSWARFHDDAGSRVVYAVEPRGAAPRGFVIERGVSAEARPARFGATALIDWGLHAPDHFEIGEGADVLRAEVARVLDCSPFYERYVARLGAAEGVGEYLDLDRFQRPGVQFLLPFRTQRRRAPKV